MKDIEILLPDFEIEELINHEIIIDEPQTIVTENDWEMVPKNASLNRVRHWLARVNCATLTAWRGDNNRETNDSLNFELQKQLRDFQYGVIKLKGYYQEVGKEAGFENSFFTFDIHSDPDFYQNIRYLSESYNQDSFLYKAANEEMAYIIGTNKYKGYTREPAGRLRFGNMDAKMFSQIGSGRFSFE